MLLLNYIFIFIFAENSKQNIPITQVLDDFSMNNDGDISDNQTSDNEDQTPVSDDQTPRIDKLLSNNNSDDQTPDDDENPPELQYSSG